MAVAEKREIRELVGVAVNTSALDLREGQERALDRVAAVGAAAASIATGGDLHGLPLAAMQVDTYRSSASMRDLMLDPGTPDARDVIASDLVPLLWHIDYGRQHGLIPRAIPLFARWLGHRRLFSHLQGAEHRPLLERFAARVLDEWLSTACTACGGTGKLERTQAGAWIRPRGAMQRNATFRPCRACTGTGKPRPSHGERARWLKITHAQYDTDRWAQRFNAGRAWVQQLLADRLVRPLTAQLERRTKRD